ncbi:MAG TPA: hypothetical protein VF618_00030 [Thermoanaerobaculia bacterium]
MIAVTIHAAPPAAITPGGALTITLPADLLRSAEVKEQLTSGLTTVFVITVSGDGVKGAARIDVRFELWEEKYLVSVIEPTGERHFSFDSEAALARWWSENPLTVTPPRKYGQRVDARVKLKLLPFSSQEQRDTRRWLARTLSGTNGDFTPAQSADILRILVETSVRRRPLLEREWSVRAEGRATP